MASPAVPIDTDPQVFAQLVERWRSMGIADRVATVEQLCADVDLLARAGIHLEHPDFTEVEVRHELARRRFGAALADAAYSHPTAG